MTTAAAIAKLREKKGWTQADLADSLGVTITSVSRYENGREPTSKVLIKLADVAKEAGARHLYDLFVAKRASDIASSVESLASEGSARRIPVWELEHIDKGLVLIFQAAQLASSRHASEEVKSKCLLEIADLSGNVRHLVRLYLAAGEEEKPLKINNLPSYVSEQESHG
jgi:transcriptional regulator with XRE-family HTH domain